MDTITLRVDALQAICDGVFSGIQQQQGANGPLLTRRPLTPDILKAVAAMADDELTARLTTYNADLKKVLQSKIDAANKQAADATAQLATLTPDS